MPVTFNRKLGEVLNACRPLALRLCLLNLATTNSDSAITDELITVILDCTQAELVAVRSEIAAAVAAWNVTQAALDLAATDAHKAPGAD